MTKHEVAILSFKVLCIYAVIQSVDRIYTFLYYLFYKNQIDIADKPNLLISAVPSILMILCAIALWFGAPLLARTIFRGNVSETKSQNSLLDIQRVAFSIAGLYMLATSLPEIVEVIAVVLTVPVNKRSPGSMIHIIVTFLFQASLGFWLLFGSRGIVNFLLYLNGKRENF
jgi:hypothetical protein